MAWMKELTHNAMTKVLSVEIWLAVLLSLLPTVFAVGVAYAYITKDVEANKRAVETTRITVASNAEQTRREVKEITNEMGEIKEILAQLAAIQQVQIEVQNTRGKRQDQELQAIRQILEQRR